MISAGIASVQRRGSEAADAIRLQPFTAKSLVQVRTKLFTETNHGRLSVTGAAVGGDNSEGLLSESSTWETVGARNVWN
jgi:hypothetical protein